jgi:hypothetical protein
MKESSTPLPASRDNASLKKYFQDVFPDMDFERVYASDMKKMIRWFELLKDKVEFKLSAEDEEAVTSSAGEEK